LLELDDQKKNNYLLELWKCVHNFYCLKDFQICAHILNMFWMVLLVYETIFPHMSMMQKGIESTHQQTSMCTYVNPKDTWLLYTGWGWQWGMACNLHETLLMFQKFAETFWWSTMLMENLKGHSHLVLKTLILSPLTPS
jgi:hypothetical protein